VLTDQQLEILDRIRAGKYADKTISENDVNIISIIKMNSTTCYLGGQMYKKKFIQPKYCNINKYIDKIFKLMLLHLLLSNLVYIFI
jgi:hypothetical protein